jgi:PAS domain S-box-containing protein
MSAILIPSLYVMSGVCAFAALHHGLAVMHRQVSQVHLLFAALCGVVTAYILIRAGAYQAHTVEELVALRRWEVAAVCVIYAIFPWLIAGFTAVRPRGFLIALSVFWCALFVVNLNLPYGAQFAGTPQLSHYTLPWGERVVDLRVVQPSLTHLIGLLSILAIMLYGAYACIAHYRRGQKRRARALGAALGLFFGSVLHNWAVNRGLIDFVHVSEFGFLSLVLMMDLEMMLESRSDKRRMRDILDHLPAAICVKDMKGRIQLVNSEFEALARLDDGAILGETGVDVFTQAQVQRVQADEQLAIETGKEVVGEYSLGDNGVQRIYQTHHFPLLHPDGSAFAVCGVYLDVTESRQKEEALHHFRRQIWHADRLVSTGAISASLAHEICQPLTAMLNNAQAGLRFLEHDRVDLEELREIFQDIVRDDKRAGTIINGLRAMLQRQETPRAEIDLAQSIEEVMELLHSELIRHGVEAERVLETNLTVRANKTQIQQVVLNLSINAIEAMADRPQGERKLLIRAMREDGKGHVSLRDSGIGIAPDMLDKVFEGFYSTKPQGLGVGLEVCHSIMQSHQGAIWAEANTDRGATFHFTLPLAENASAGDSAPDA